jgi:hypothetical protein
MKRNPTAANETMNVTLTIDERDRIDAAKTRIRALAILLSALNDEDGNLLERSTDDLALALDVLVEMLRDASAAIDETFHAADARQKAA